MYFVKEQLYKSQVVIDDDSMISNKSNYNHHAINNSQVCMMTKIDARLRLLEPYIKIIDIKEV